MANRYSIYPPSFTYAGPTTMDLQQIDQVGMTPGSRVRTVRPGGALSPAAHILSTANPTSQFSTADILTPLTAMGGNFHLFCSGGHVSRYQLRAEGGTFASGSVHHTQTSAKGFLHIASLDVDIDSEDGGRIQLEYIPLSVAGENPFTDSATASFASAPVPAFMSQYFLGGVVLNATQLLGLKRFSVRPGIRFGTNRSDGGVFPRSDSSSILAYDPMIELTFLNVAIGTTIGTAFQTVLPNALKVYFQRGTTAIDGRIAAATASHTKITAAAGSWGQENVSVSGNDDGTTTVTIRPTTALAITTGVALLA